MTAGGRWVRAGLVVLALVGTVIVALTGCGRGRDGSPPAAAQPAITHADIGFRSRSRLDEHFRKHGREFGDIDRDRYLALAQELRDRPVGGAVLEARRGDGVTTRFDRSSGAFVAFNRDLTIRTFFRPNDGIDYFRRQAGR